VLAGRGDVERDRVAGVDQTQLRIEQADQAALPLDLGFDRIAAQQCLDDADIFFHVLEPHRAEPHRAPPGEPGADAEIDPPRRQLVERGKSVGGDRGEPVRRDQDAGREADAGGLHRRRRHRHERVGGEHLRVVEPGAVKAQFLGATHDPPAIRVGGQGDREAHLFLPAPPDRITAETRSRYQPRHTGEGWYPLWNRPRR
jgi:hypothetical protein